MRPIKAVIFDMDGVLIDSEPVYLHHQYTQLKPSYPWITLESMHPLVGISGQEYMPFMAKLCRRTDDAAFRQEMDAMNAGCRVYYPDILRKEVRPLLHELKQMGLQVALASSSSRECIEQVLTQCEIRELFDCIVSGREFTRSKPDPEIYRFTMDKLGRKPEECLIVEDSTYGVQAGTAAGGVVAALRDERFPFDQRAAQLHIDSLAELPALVRAAEKGYAPPSLMWTAPCLPWAGIGCRPVWPLRCRLYSAAACRCFCAPAATRWKLKKKTCCPASRLTVLFI